MIPSFLKFYGYLKKDFMLMYKRKKYLSMFILLPLVIGILFLFFINSGGYTIDVAVCNYDDSISSALALGELKDFDVELLDGGEVECPDLIKEGISSGKYSLGLEIPSGFSSNIEDLKQSKVNIYYDNTDIAFSSLVAWKVEESLEPFERAVVDSINSNVKGKASVARSGLDFLESSTGLSSRLEKKFDEVDDNLRKIVGLETEFIVNPVWVNHIPLNDKSIVDSAIAFIFPILAMFVILMLASTSLIYDKKSLFIIRVKSSTSPALYLFAKLLFFVCLTIVQFLIIFGLFLISGANYSFSWLNLLELIVAISFLNTLIGFLIGLISDNEGIAVLFSLMIAFPLMLVSGIFYPVQTLPGFVRWFSNILPLNYQIESTKMVLLFNQNISNWWIVYSLVLFCIVWLVVKRKI
jgi:ABC-2 type transport system permease protein